MVKASQPPEDLDGFLERILQGARDEDGRFRAFMKALNHHLALPCRGWVMDHEVRIVALRYKGQPRRGIVAVVSDDAKLHPVSLADVRPDPSARGALHLTAYRAWMGLPPSHHLIDWAASKALLRPALPGRAEQDGGAPAATLDLVVLSVQEDSAECRDLKGIQRISLRLPGGCDLVPGEVVTIKPHHAWVQDDRHFLRGEVIERQIDARLLDLTPLELWSRGHWDPSEGYWGAPGQPIDPCYVPILQAGPRPSYEMDQLLPGCMDDTGEDPIMQAIALHKEGDHQAAHQIVNDLVTRELRCLDSHAHLGVFAFEKDPVAAQRHYEVGVRIGELSLPAGFRGVLPWTFPNNRPFLRCLEGLGLCLWRRGHHKEATEAFQRLLWLNPGDHQGVRFLLWDLRMHRPCCPRS